MKQSFAWWAFSLALAPEDQPGLLTEAVAAGMDGVEMLPPHLRGAAAHAGLVEVTTMGHDIEVGFNDPANHAMLHERVGAAIADAAAAVVPMVIVFSGNDNGLDGDAAIANCAAGLAPLATDATAAGVTLVLELLNSKVDHPGYQCDHSAFGFEVVRQVDSPGLRVLFDCYHMQVMEGDLLATMKADVDLIGHVHTAGVPGRRDLDDRQEVNWRAVAGMLRHAGYDGWVGHEFMPRGEPGPALAAAAAHFAP